MSTINNEHHERAVSAPMTPATSVTPVAESAPASALNIANTIIYKYPSLRITNLRINKLLFFMQVAAVKYRKHLLFADDIQAWRYGPVVPEVYQAFKHYGHAPIERPSQQLESLSQEAFDCVQQVMKIMGNLTAYDLVQLTHKQGGAWQQAYQEGANAIISEALMRSSTDTLNVPSNTLSAGFAWVDKHLPNTFKLLENS